MIKFEFKRYFFSKTTVFILFFLLIVSCISFFTSLSEKQEWVYQLQSGVDPNLNTKAVISVIENYSGLQFLFNLWFNSLGVDVVLIIVLISWIGVSFSPRMQIEKENGFGDLVITRSIFKKRFYDILIAQSLYIVSVMFIYVMITVILAMTFGGLPTAPFKFADQYFSILKMSIITFLQFIWLSLVVLSINAFCLACNVWIENKYLLQILPFVLFVIVPVLAGTIIGNSIPITAPALMLYQPEVLVGALGYVFQPYATFFNFIEHSTVVITTLILFAVIYPIYIKKWSEDYL